MYKFISAAIEDFIVLIIEMKYYFNEFNVNIFLLFHRCSSDYRLPDAAWVSIRLFALLLSFVNRGVVIMLSVYVANTFPRCWLKYIYNYIFVIELNFIFIYP